MNNKPLVGSVTGSGGLIGLVITLLIGFALMLMYLKSSMPSRKAEQEAGQGAIDRTREQAKRFEEEQRSRDREMREAVQQ